LSPRFNQFNKQIQTKKQTQTIHKHIQFTDRREREVFLMRDCREMKINLRDLNFLRYAVLKVLREKIGKKIRYCGIALALQDAGKNFDIKDVSNQKIRLFNRFTLISL